MSDQPQLPISQPTTTSIVPVAMHRSDYEVYASLTKDKPLAQLATRFASAYQLFLRTMRCYDNGGQVMLCGKGNNYWWNNIHPEPQFFEPSRESLDYRIKRYSMVLPGEDELYEMEMYLDSMGLRTPEDATLTIMTFYLRYWKTGKQEKANLHLCYPSMAQKSQYLPDSAMPFFPFDHIREPIDDDSDYVKSQLVEWHTHMQTPTGSQLLMACTE